MEKRISYVADDGSVFFTKEDCLNHEADREKEKDLREKARMQRERDKERIKEMRVDIGVYPIVDSGYTNFNDCYLDWYLIKNKEDYNLLEKYCEYIDKIEEFPAYVCCYDTYNILENDLCCENTATFKCCVDIAKEFFNAFGYEMELKKKGGK